MSGHSDHQQVTTTRQSHTISQWSLPSATPEQATQCLAQEQRILSLFGDSVGTAQLWSPQQSGTHKCSRMQLLLPRHTLSTYLKAQHRAYLALTPAHSFISQAFWKPNLRHSLLGNPSIISGAGEKEWGPMTGLEAFIEAHGTERVIDPA